MAVISMPGTVEVTTGKVVVTAGKVVVTAGRVVVTTGKVVVTAGKVVVTAGIVIAIAAKVLVDTQDAKHAAADFQPVMPWTTLIEISSYLRMMKITLWRWRQ